MAPVTLFVAIEAEQHESGRVRLRGRSHHAASYWSGTLRFFQRRPVPQASPQDQLFPIDHLVAECGDENRADHADTRQKVPLHAAPGGPGLLPHKHHNTGGLAVWPSNRNWTPHPASCTNA